MRCLAPLRPALPLLLPLLFGACQQAAGPGSDTAAGPPPGMVGENGTGLYVERVEQRSGRTAVTLTLVNGTDDPVHFSRSHTPFTLVGTDGATLEGPKQDLEVPAFSRDRVTVTFEGTPRAPLTLRPGGSSALERLALPNLPGDVAFAGAAPAPRTFAAASQNHANGSTLAVTGLSAGPETVDVLVQAINGSKSEIRLNSSDQTYLQDAAGRRYPLVPPPANPALTIPEGQALSGTLRFAGRLPADATGLTLYVNARSGSDNEHARTPKMVVTGLDAPAAGASPSSSPASGGPAAGS